MPWILLVVGLVALALGLNVLRPTRSLAGFVLSFFAEWLVAELAHFTLLALAAAVVVCSVLGGLDHPAGWIGLIVAAVGAVCLVVEEALALRSRAAVRTALADAGLAQPRPDRGRVRRLLVPLWLGDRRVERIPDLAYRPDGLRRHRCDVYRPRGGVTGAPVLVQVHGGAWLVGNKRQQGRPLMNRMAAAGWVCVAVNYRLAPRTKMPGQIVDVKAALAWVHAEIAAYGGDPARVVVTGGSAGGHLAAFAALTPGDPEFQPGFEDADTSVLAAVPVYPPTDLIAMFRFRSRRDTRRAGRAAAMVFGATPEEDPDRYRRLSPIERISGPGVPQLVVQGSADNLVPASQTCAYVERLRAEPGQEVVYLEVPGAPHAFDVFHSVRSEAVVGAIHTWCDSVAARAADRTGGG